ncbi:MAG: fibronectin type III domain-containing protein [Crocinitomicaceae bacterium]
MNCTSDQVVSSSLATTIPHSYIPTTSASYAMIFTHPGGCLDTTDCLNVTVNPGPNDPTNLQATAITSPLSVSLTWNDNSFNEDGFEIERGTDGVNSSIGDVVANVTTYTDNTVAPNTTYYYRVIAWNTSYLSDYSNGGSNYFNPQFG